MSDDAPRGAERRESIRVEIDANQVRVGTASAEGVKKPKGAVGVDLSRGGMRLRLTTLWGAPEVGQKVRVAVTFPGGDVELVGIVRHLRKGLVQSDVGIAFDPADNDEATLDALGRCLDFFEPGASTMTPEEREALEAFRLEIVPVARD